MTTSSAPIASTDMFKLLTLLSEHRDTSLALGSHLTEMATRGADEFELQLATGLSRQEVRSLLYSHNYGGNVFTSWRELCEHMELPDDLTRGLRPGRERACHVLVYGDADDTQSVVAAMAHTLDSYSEPVLCAGSPEFSRGISGHSCTHVIPDGASRLARFAITKWWPGNHDTVALVNGEMLMPVMDTIEKHPTLACVATVHAVSREEALERVDVMCGDGMSERITHVVDASVAVLNARANA